MDVTYVVRFVTAFGHTLTHQFTDERVAVTYAQHMVMAGCTDVSCTKKIGSWIGFPIEF